MALDKKTNPSYVGSPWGSTSGPIKEDLANGNTIVIPKGSSGPDYLRKVYGVASVASFSGRYSFMTRDYDDKSYQPGSTDKFVFSGWNSVNDFKNDAIDQLHYLNFVHASFGGILKKDSKRQIGRASCRERV